ncbi:MAG: RidA family protein [Candidatus Hydrothermota bacterium]|nr:MAG: RidA family protein [Candidatus Hydrothermae bacterium]
MAKKKIVSSKAPSAIGPYSQAIEVDGFVFTAGQIGIDPQTGQLVDGIEAQAERALMNIKAVLEAAGCTMNDVVKTTIFMVDIADFPKVNAIYEKFFDEPYPARSTVAVAALPKGALIEIEVVARRRA